MKTLDRKQIVSVLLVEDDPDDVEITQRAFHRGNILNPLHVTRDGEEAMAFLKGTGRYAGRRNEPPPGLILLDLNLPRLDGREVLRLIKQDPELRTLPVIVLTTSDEESDVDHCYEDGANSYITKPVDFHKFVDAVVTIGKYWLCVAEIPTRRPHA